MIKEEPGVVYETPEKTPSVVYSKDPAQKLTTIKYILSLMGVAMVVLSVLLLFFANGNFIIGVLSGVLIVLTGIIILIAFALDAYIKSLV